MKTDGIILGETYALAGPSEKLDPTRVPVRGDLAHIRLAGRVFVPHYVVPTRYTAKAGAYILRAPGGEALTALEPGTAFDVLDLAAGHGWGEVPGGAVGYVALDHLEKGE